MVVPVEETVAEPSWVRRRLVEPVLVLLKQGSTPRQIAMSIAIGAVIGVFPVLGTTSAICLAVAWIFRLNIPAMQLPNYVVYPVQLALIIPFIRLGERLFHAPRAGLSLTQLVALFQNGTLHAIRVVWQSLMYASAAWALVAPVSMITLYAVLLPVVRRLSKAYAARRNRAVAL